MLGFDRGFEILGVHCSPVPEQELRFHYLPLSADCQRGPDGRPQAHLLAAGSTAFLQLSTVWDVPAARLEEVRAALAARLGAEPALVQLAFAPVTVQAVRLMAGDGAAAEREIAVTRSSGIVPHSAMFNLPLTGADRDRAMAAFSGRTGFLQVRYEASMPAPVRHEARLSGDLSMVATVGELEAALADGRAALAFDPADAELRDAFVLRAVEILRFLHAEPGSLAEIVVELVVDAPLALEVATDVGGWFEGGPGRVIPVPGLDPPEPAPADGLEVSLDLPGVENVVAEIEVESGAARARLSAPGFAPVTLPVAGEPVRVRTRYVGGGAEFEAERTAPEGPLALAAGDLGLIEVTIDAAPLAARGLERLRTTLRYRPEGPGERAERTFYMRAPPFSARWLLVARGEPLGTSLTYDLRATLTSGEDLDHGPVAALSPAITLGANPEE
jgi:hypothetical protein